MSAPIGRPGRSPDVPWPAAVDGLRRAAGLIDPDAAGAAGDDVVVCVDVPVLAAPSRRTQLALPAPVARPIRDRMRSVAASIELARSLAGRAVTYDLTLAGRLLGEDLLNPDPGADA